MTVDPSRWEKFTSFEKTTIAYATTLLLGEMIEDEEVSGHETAALLEVVSTIVSELCLVEGNDGVDPTLLHQAMKILRVGAQEK